MNYKIKKDKNNNDILIQNGKEIPLNKKNTLVEYQSIISNYCINNSEYESYEIKTNLYLIKEIKKHKDYNEYNIHLLNDKDIELVNDIEDDNTSSYISFNSKYIVTWQMEYACPIINVKSAYDIENNKIIDCSNFQTNMELIDGVVKYRRCLYDVIASILTNQVLMIDEQRLYNFMSFIINEKVNKDNFELFIPIVQKYIYQNYPQFKGSRLCTDRKELINLNELYGIDYFKFRKMDYTIPNLKYIKNKTKSLVKR